MLMDVREITLHTIGLAIAPAGSSRALAAALTQRRHLQCLATVRDFLLAVVAMTGLGALFVDLGALRFRTRFRRVRNPISYDE